MKKELKLAQKELETEAKKRKYTKDGKNHTVLNMTVKNDDDFLSVFSENNTPIISTEVAEFIENTASALPLKESLTLRIHSDCIDSEEQVIYRQAIKEYYVQKYISNERELKRNRLVMFLLAFAGILVLALALVYEYTGGGPIWTEVIDIVAWVFLWEAVDIGILGNRIAKLQKRRYLAFLLMDVEYVSEAS